jgi:hypothetical protein
MVFGVTTYREFVAMLAASDEEPEVLDPWVTRMRSMPATVVLSTLEEPLDWLGDATVGRGDAVDRVQLTIFPVITGEIGTRSVFEDAADFDL